jgi:aldose 1-epimerase
VDVADQRLVLEAGGVRAIVLPGDGGRLGSVTVDGAELLMTHGSGPIDWGSYPMAPWAGRVRHGRFGFGGVEHRLPITLAPHAIHGVVYDRPWTVLGPDAIAIDLDERWPFRGRVTQRFVVDEDGLEVAMTLEAEEPMPVVLGWHPWFRRVIGPAGGSPVGLAFHAESMLVRDAEGIPTGARVAPPEGPWDDAFTGVSPAPVLEWPGRLRLELTSSCPWWVVYTMPEAAICVEPQSGPPDAVNDEPEVVRPGEPMIQRMRWSLTRL